MIFTRSTPEILATVSNLRNMGVTFSRAEIPWLPQRDIVEEAHLKLTKEGGSVE